MGIVAVHAAIGEQTEDMQARPILLCVVHRLQECFVFKETAALDFLRDPDQILVHDPAGTYIQMTHLGTAHLSVWETNGQAAGITLREGVFLHQPIHYRRICQRDGIVFRLLTQAIAIEDQQDSRSFAARFFFRVRGGYSWYNNIQHKRCQQHLKQQSEMESVCHINLLFNLSLIFTGTMPKRALPGPTDIHEGVSSFCLSIIGAVQAEARSRDSGRIQRAAFHREYPVPPGWMQMPGNSDPIQSSESN